MTTSSGATIWFTGLPASGKSTIARIVYQALLDRGIPVELLDGSQVRENLSRGLGWSPADREEHIRRMGFVAKLLSRNGVIAVCCAVSPYRATRDEVRRNTTNFVEVFVDCAVEVAEGRDRGGWYASARRGETMDFTGVNAPYEPPLRPEVHVRSDQVSAAEGAEQVIRFLEERDLIPSAEDAVTQRMDDLRRLLASEGYV